jgi:hypothetical protein
MSGASREALAHPVRGVCQTGRHADPGVAHPTGLLAGPPSQPGQGGAGRAARGGSADGGPRSRRRRSDRGLDRALYAVGLSLAYAQDLSEHLAVLAGDSAGLASASETTEKSLNFMCMGRDKSAPTVG